ncbi:MAG: hypothetical protein P8I12_02435 [SAR86 cluster bacterium]|nr:hypothetical protein [SAR86 cluster bacterium]
MKKVLIIFCFLFIVSCGPSQQEKENVAAVTCSIMSETKNIDAAIRVREMNNAREKIGKGPFLRGDEAIKEAFEYGLCKELVLSESYDETLQPLKDAKREREKIAADKADQERLEKILKLAEDKRKKEEKQRLADSKPTVEEVFYYNGNKKRTSSYQPKSDGGKLHGPYKEFFLNGQIKLEVNYINGNKEGLMVIYYEDGRIRERSNYKINELHGLKETFYKNTLFDERELTRKQQLETRTRYYKGTKQGIDEKYQYDGTLLYKNCYMVGNEVNMSDCYIQ